MYILFKHCTICLCGEPVLRFYYEHKFDIHVNDLSIVSHLYVTSCNNV